MARTPLLQLNDIALTFGGDPVFSDLSLVVQPGDRLALVGRNGSGKSTLMKVMAGLVEPDAGERIVAPGTSVGYMEQEPDMTGFATLGDFAAARLDPSEHYRVEMASEGLKFDPARPVETASGGERRRAALARLMAEAPELMLLDEPTNHLDIEAIAWLEAELSQTRAAFLLISHDRAFLRALAKGTLWIDRGAVRRQDEGFAGFEAWRDKIWEGGHRPPQAGPQDQGRGEMGGRGHLGPAQAQSGPRACAAGPARRTGRPDPAAGHGGDGPRLGPEIRPPRNGGRGPDQAFRRPDHRARA